MIEMIRNATLDEVADEVRKTRDSFEAVARKTTYTSAKQDMGWAICACEAVLRRLERMKT